MLELCDWMVKFSKCAQYLDVRAFMSLISGYLPSSDLHAKLVVFLPPCKLNLQNLVWTFSYNSESNISM
jgi:hypothetical protein